MKSRPNATLGCRHRLSRPQGSYTTDNGTNLSVYRRVRRAFRVPRQGVLHGNLSGTYTRSSRTYVSRVQSVLCVKLRLSAAQNDNLQVHEEKSRGVYVKNLSDYYVSSAREVYEIMRQGGAARVVSSTSMLLLYKVGCRS